MRTAPAETQIAVALAARDAAPTGQSGTSYSGTAWNVEGLRRSIVAQSFRRNLPFTAEHLCGFLDAWLKQRYGLEQGSGSAVLGVVEQFLAERGLPAEMRLTLRAIRDRLERERYPGRPPTKAAVQIAERIDRLLNPAAAAERPLPAGPMADTLNGWIDTLSKEAAAVWLSFARHCAEAGNKSKPSGKWLETARKSVEKLGPAPFIDRLRALMDVTTPHPAEPDRSHDILKGLLWSASVLDDATLAGEIGRFAEKCYQKIPDIGARSVALGNAALWSLSAMTGQARAAAELFRLREKIKYPSARKLMDTRLDELAEKRGATVEEMEDHSLPSFGLDAESRLTVRFGDARVELAIGPTEATQQWYAANGLPTKSPPAEARTAGDFKAWQRQAKDIEAARQTQVLRLEQSWVEERGWPFGDWERHFLGHPLRRPIVEGLIWRIDEVAVMPEAGALKDVTGRTHSFGPDARVRLWHPLDAEPQQVLAWRARILERGLTQPIKQAHREIYVLTDAERATGTYSNRFAAHILRQHQFRALCNARGWKYALMGHGWDGWNAPTRPLPKLGLTVEYQVEVVEDDQHTHAQVALHLASDQVRFLDVLNSPVSLAEIAPIVFSEMLRDVDLFVAVTSIANDPRWTDGGPNGRNAGYWREWAFGELGQSAATRKALISWLVPKLSIADKLEITDKFLVVQGRRQKYAIHFGSSNIQILPSNRYLCIVPDRAPKEATNVRLPFAGDGLLSVILSKAFLLVDENRITDETILRQL